jgi:hypothetical protein
VLSTRCAACSREKFKADEVRGQDDDLLNRDYTAATESAVDMSMLPKVMQVRNFGKVRVFACFDASAYVYVIDVADEIYTSYGSGHFRGWMGYCRTTCSSWADGRYYHWVLELWWATSAQRSVGTHPCAELC